MIYLILTLCAARLLLFVLCAMFRAMRRDVDRIRANCLPYCEEDYQEQTEQEQPEQKQIERPPRPLYDAQAEQAKQERIARKERERIQRERIATIKRDRQNNLARFDSDHWAAECEKLKEQAAEIEKRMEQETGKRTLEELQKQLDTIDRKLYLTERKRIIAQDKIL